MNNDGPAPSNDNHSPTNDGRPQISTDPTWPINLVQIIRNLISTATSKPDVPKFNFGLTKEAAEHNAMVLKKYGNDLERAIQTQRGCSVGYGSKFWPKDQLVQLFGLYPCWLRMESILTRGSFWPLEDLDKDLRKQDVDEALAFGNHKGTQKLAARL